MVPTHPTDGQHVSTYTQWSYVIFIMSSEARVSDFPPSLGLKRALKQYVLETWKNSHYDVQAKPLKFVLPHFLAQNNLLISFSL